MSEMARTEQIVHLEGNEDVHAVRGIIARAQAERLVLVVPRGHRAFRSLVRLKLIARQAHDRGVDIALVTRDPDVRELARDIRLATFRSVGAAQKADRWRQPSANALDSTNGHYRAPLDWQRGREAVLARREQLGAPANWVDRFVLLGLVLGVLIVIVAGAVLVVPAATITLIPAQSELNVPFEFTADVRAEGVFLRQGRIPAQRHVITVEGTAQTATSGRKDVPDKPATGAVTFVNLLPQDVPIPAGTIVRTSAAVPIRFRTTEDAVVPANGRVSVPVEALNPGPTGNVGAMLINQVEGPASTAVRVFNPEPTQGGTVRQVQVVTAADKDQLRAQLSQRLAQEARTALERAVPEGFVLVPGSVTIEPVTETFDRLVDEQADVLMLQYRLRASGLIVNQRDVLRVGRRTVQAQVPPDRILLEEGFRVQLMSGEPLGDGEMRVTATVTGVTAARIDGNAVRDLVRGQPVDEAYAVLVQRLPLAADPGIDLSPAWWSRMPYLPLRITVRVAALPPSPGG
ncbi:MAG: baseplate J/gp47 family protein [Ardenticatenia bacterium]|nr:baseplate J/gp47 family protein [Ardenticatenia bacterium]